MHPGPPDFSSSHSVHVDAPPDRCYECIRTVDMSRSPLMRMLLTARGLRRLHTLDDAIELGFVTLADDPPRELVLGLIGQPWRPRGNLRRLAPEAMEAFDEPGFVKVSWRFTVTPTGASTLVSTATDIWATSVDAGRKFGRYWKVVGPFSAALRRSILAGVRRCAAG